MLTVATAPTRQTLVAYLRYLLERSAALGDSELIVREFHVGGLRVKARFTNERLAALYLKRLGADIQTDAEDLDLRVDVLETAPLGWEPPADWGDPTYDEALFENRVIEAGLRATYPYQPRLWQVFDRKRGHALQLAATSADLPVWDPGAPLRLPIHWAALQAGRRRLVHAAVVGEGEDGILMAGPGGAGKSGTTLAAIANGMHTVGDDYVMLELGQRSTAWPVYRLLKQDPAGIGRFPALLDRLAGRPLNWQGKIEIDPEECFPGCWRPHMRLRAIVLPTIAGAASSRLEPLARGEAIERLTRSTISQLPGDERSAVAIFTALATRLPAYRLHLSSHPAEIAATLRGLLRQAR